MPYAFISYMRENAETITTIKRRIDALGVEVWIDTQNIRPGEDWEPAIRRGIEGASLFLAFFSREFEGKARSPMHSELRLAASEVRNHAHDHRWILPVVLSPCRIPDYPLGDEARLDRLQRIDLYRDWESGMTRLLAELQPLALPPPIIVLGSGNGDHVLTHTDPIAMGTKNFVDSQQLLGGSGLNATSRLLAAGFNARPILSVGPDRLGEMVRDHLLACYQGHMIESSCEAFLNDESFFAAEIRTPQSTIVVDGDRRTIFAEKLDGGHHYFSHVLARLQKVLVGGDDTVAAVLIGHIHTDGRRRSDGSDRDEARWGECTRYLIDRFAGKCPIFLNFGRSQIDLGAEFWDTDLRRISMVQLNLAEAQRFFRRQKEIRSSYAIFDWFRERGISFALTFGRFGAVATLRDGADGAVMAWPAIEKHEVVDTTGAGDAFAAGCVSVLQGRTEWTFPKFYEALSVGRIWAGYACSKLGACSEPPGERELGEFSSQRENLARNRRIRNIQVLDEAVFRRELQTFDAIFED